MGNSELTLNSTEFFKGLVDDALDHLHLETIPLAKHYLVQLLNSHIYNSTFIKDDKTLAEILLTATSEQGAKQIELLRNLGDTCLYLGGFFSESLNRKIIDLDYYINMGETAYGTLSGVVREDTFKLVYTEYSNKFRLFIDALTYISQKSKIQSDSDLLALYDRYLTTGSSLARDQLIEKGLLPVKQKKINQ